jgi:hypothetical protein
MNFFSLFLFIILFSFSQIYAQDCEGLKDGEIINLDGPNKSLHNFKVQDQDGLGVCYANAASLLLQAILPNNPEVSYLHLASLSINDELSEKRQSQVALNIYAQKVDDPDKAVNGRGLTTQWDLAIDGGHTCDVIQKTIAKQESQKKPILCSRSGMNLERILSSEDNDHKQFKTILSTSQYMNIFQNSFVNIDEEAGFFNKKSVLNKRKKYISFRDSLDKIISDKKISLEKNECNKINTAYLSSLFNSIIPKVLAYESCFNTGESTYNYRHCKTVRKILNTPTINSDDSVQSNGINSNWMTKISQALSSRKSRFEKDDILNDIKNSFLADINIKERNEAKDLLSSFTNDKIFNLELEKLSKEYKEVTETGSSSLCIDRNLYNYFEQNEFEADWNKDLFLCKHSELLKQATKLVIDYKQSGLNNLNNVIKFLTVNANLDYDSAMISLYATDCADSAKITIPKKIECFSNKVSIENKSTTNLLIIDRIKNNQPLVANLCSAILKKPKDQFRMNECGNHALGVTGLKCVGGKFKYLIQNSWGANSKAYNAAIENVEGKGSYWFDETTFFDSVYSLEHLL